MQSLLSQQTRPLFVPIVPIIQPPQLQNQWGFNAKIPGAGLLNMQEDWMDMPMDEEEEVSAKVGACSKPNSCGCADKAPVGTPAYKKCCKSCSGLINMNLFLL